MLADGQRSLLFQQNPRNGTLQATSGFGLERYANYTGTSMASPHAAACAALAWAVAPSATRTEVLDALLSTAHDLGDPGSDQTYGYGLVGEDRAEPSSRFGRARDIRSDHGALISGSDSTFA